MGMQFTEPSIRDVLDQARADGMERLVCLPVYPLCGRSTTIAALADVRRDTEAMDWDIDVFEISGWHNHPDYARLHADNIRAFVAERGVDLDAAGTRLVFSAHGTPVKYLNDGNRYDRYVDEICEALSRELGGLGFTLGFQNHGNRPIEWTQPDIDTAVASLDGTDAVVVAVSFMHEQSETLAELDHDLREEVEAQGLAFHRVPVPFDTPRFIDVLADLVEARLEGPGADVGGRELRPCLCRSTGGACCLNGQA
jgi:ferrochelatase